LLYGLITRAYSVRFITCETGTHASGLVYYVIPLPNGPSVISGSRRSVTLTLANSHEFSVVVTIRCGDISRYDVIGNGHVIVPISSDAISTEVI